MTEHIPLNIEHHFELYRILAEQQGRMHNIEYAFSLHNTFPNYIFNPSGTLDVPSIVEGIRQKKLPPFWITEDETLNKTLSDHGFRTIREWPLMVMRPDMLTVNHSVDHFKLVKVQTTNEVELWGDIIAEVYNYVYEKKYLHGLLDKPTVDLFLGQVAGDYVSATLNFTHHQVVGSHLTATKKEYRKKGIGMQTVYSALNHAFNEGAIMSIASTTAMGEGAWKKIGYHILPAKLYINWLVGNFIQ